VRLEAPRRFHHFQSEPDDARFLGVRSLLREDALIGTASIAPIPTRSKTAPAQAMACGRKWSRNRRDDVARSRRHGVAPHMQAYRAKVKDFVKGMELRV